MGKIISIANQKGGVGKTTTAINLAASLAAVEHSTLVIDIDPQSNTTSGIGIESKTVTNSVYEVMVGGVDASDAVRETELPFLEIIPSHINLVGAEIEMIDREQRERILEKAIADLKDEYDFIIIDCPPSLGLLTINALTAADGVLIPLQCEYYALEGLARLLRTVERVREALLALPGLRRLRHDRMAGGLWALVLLNSLVVMATYATGWGRFIVPVLPPLLVLGSLGLVDLHRAIRRPHRQPRPAADDDASDAPPEPAS